jgi:hypothetical protein
VQASIDGGVLDPGDPRWARHPGVRLPIATATIDRAATELDLAVAVAEVYHTDPSFAAPAKLWRGLAQAIPTLLGTPRPHQADTE